MKSLLILVLGAGLLAAAFFTRPSKADFDAFAKTQVQGTAPTGVAGALRGLANNISADAYTQSVTFHDRYLWTSVERDGQTQYIGAFSHWFQRGATGASKAPAV